jgi:hypothetical protein
MTIVVQKYKFSSQESVNKLISEQPYFIKQNCYRFYKKKPRRLNYQRGLNAYSIIILNCFFFPPSGWKHNKAR